jgi:PAS domain-containing protein
LSLGGRSCCTWPYPIGDVVTISLVIFLLAGSRSATWLPLLLVGSGLVAITFSDSLFAYLTQTGLYSSGDLIDIGWFVGYLLVMLGALLPERQRHVTGEPRTGAGWTVVLPYVPVLVAGSLTGYKLARGTRIDAFLGVLILLQIVLVIVRQLMAVLENLALARELESKVKLRTAELAHREQHFRSLVQNGSDLTLVVGRDATIAYASPSAQRLLGWPAESLAHQTGHLPAPRRRRQADTDAGGGGGPPGCHPGRGVAAAARQR